MKLFEFRPKLFSCLKNYNKATFMSDLMAGITVCAIPGPCAVITALSISGQSTGRFCFEGFLSTAKKSRREHLEALIGETRTMIFYEAPHKLRATLSDMEAAFGSERKISLCRELTKLNEEVLRFTLAEAVKYYGEREPRGEYVLVVEGAPDGETKEDWSYMSIKEHVESYIASGMSKMDAIKAVAKDRGVPKNVIYKEFI
mgnify:CR=1 FL=1